MVTTKSLNNNFEISRTVKNQNDTNYSNVTKFTFEPSKSVFGNNLEKISYIKWNFGNNSYSNRKIVSNMVFNSSGVFDVKVLIYDNTGKVYNDKIIVTVEDYINESIKFSKVPPPTFAGHLNRYPFEIEITSSINEDHFVDLYCQFSKSYPTLDNPTNYSFLRPQWYFLDTKLNLIKEIKTTLKEKIYVNSYGEKGTSNDVLVGFKKTAEFYFVDDWFNQDQIIKNEQYTTIWATLRKVSGLINKQTDSIDGIHPIHANSTAQAFVPYVTLWREPDTIKFTRNGVNPIPMQWENGSFPLILSVGYKNHIYSDSHNNENSIKLADRLGGFAHYIPVSKEHNTSLKLVFSNNFSPVSSFLIPKEQPIIQYKDSSNFLCGGYYKTNYKQNSSGTINLSAALEYSEPNLEANNYNPLLWILNPTHGDINIAQYVFTTNPIINSPQYFTSTSIDSYNDLFKTNRIPIEQTFDRNPNMDTAVVLNKKTKLKNSPHVSSVIDNKKSLNGLNSVAALNFPTYHAWVADSELDRLYRVTSDGNIYLDIDLKNFNINVSTENWTPNNLVIDGQLNVFVSLLNARHILKFDDKGNFLNFVNLGNIIPISIDTDKNNNLYVSGIDRSQTKQSVLLKYDKNLNQISSRTFTNTFLGNILVSPDNRIYIVNQGHYNKNLSQNYDNLSFISILNCENLTTIQNLQTFPAIKHMVLDKNNNLFFNHSYNKISKFSNTNKFIKTVDIVPIKKNDTINKTIIDGLSYNLNNRLYVINSLDNTVHVLTSDNDLNQESFFYINPSNIEYKINNSGQLEIPYNPEKSEYSLSLKANGDLNGWKWNYKYSYYKGLNQKYLSNRSNNIWFAKQNNFKFLGINENFDMARYMYEFSFMKTLKESPFLYNDKFIDAEIKQNLIQKINTDINSLQNDLNNTNLVKTDEQSAYLQDEIDKKQKEILDINSQTTKGFFGSIFGSYPYQPTDLGVSVFSKIANFVKNSSDVETCDIRHLLDLTKMTDIEDDDFNINFPEGISRIVNYASISPFKLMGIKCQCGDVFKSESYEDTVCSYCGKEKISNKGEIIESLSYNVTAGNTFVLRFLNSKNKYRKITTGLLDNKNVYTMSELMTSIGFPYDWRKNYTVYEYVPTPKDYQLSNSFFLTAYNFQTLNSLYTNISRTSAELNVISLLTPLVSTINYSLTSFAFFSTFSPIEWNMHLNDLKSKTILNRTVNIKQQLSSSSYYNEISSFSINFIDLNDYLNNLNTIINTNGYHKHVTLTNNLSAINYKIYFPLDKKYRIENSIDWENPQTTLTINENSNDWYKNNGIIDKMINFELQKGLGLI
jgi:hypothetical protein